jgi:hypothetical protein
LLTATASGKTTVTRIGVSSQAWYINTESPVSEFVDLTWEPDGSGGKDDIRFEPLPPLLASAARTIHRPISWRLDEGQIRNFDWKKVRNEIWAKYKFRIGDHVAVSVPAMTVVTCYKVCGCVYACYSREVYEIDQNGFKAVVSVLKPVNGIAVTFETCCLLEYPSCNGSPPPENTASTCASANALPHDGDCSTTGSGRTKWDIRDDPLLTDGNSIESTWGKIKSLYNNN